MFPYSTNPTWSDITPIPQLDENITLVNIGTTEKFNETMGYFRAILAANEYSDRTLLLTEDVIDLNSANYTAWHFRRCCLRALKDVDYEKEMSYLRQMASISPKNYQIWHHRRFVFEQLYQALPISIGDEIDNINDILQRDSKNYHIWSYKQWLLRTYADDAIWKNELEFIDKLLRLDIRNNSAWNQRQFVLSIGLPKVYSTSSGLHDELEYVIKQATQAHVPSNVKIDDDDDNFDNFHHDDPENEDGERDMDKNADKNLQGTVSTATRKPVFLNESLWNYCEALMKSSAFKSFKKLALFAQQAILCKPTCRFAMSLLVETLLDDRCIAFDDTFWNTETIHETIDRQLDTGIITFKYPSIPNVDVDMDTLVPFTVAVKEERVKNLKKAIDYCNSLFVTDSVRSKYWYYRKQQILDLIQREDGKHAQ